jgi:hypothetical protein
LSGDLDVNVCVTSGCSVATEKWDGTVTGQLASGKIQNGSVTGTIVPTVTQTAGVLAGGGTAFSVTSTRLFNGSMSGVFTGTNSRGLVIDFNLTESDSSNYLSGVSLLKINLPDPALTSLELASLVNYGFANIRSGTNKGVLVGESPSLTYPSTSTLLANSNVVLRSHTSYSSEISYDVGESGVSWGMWYANVPDAPRLQTDRNDGSVFTAIDSNVIFVSVPLSPVNSRTGTRKFVEEGHYFARHSRNDTPSLDGGFDVNLDSGAVSNGFLHIGIEASGLYYKWKVENFSGTLSNGILAKTNVSGAVYPDAYNNTAVTETPSISGTINGAVTGDNANNFVLGFDLTSGTDFLAGAALFKVHIPQPALSSIEEGTLSRVGFALLGPGPNQGLLFGQAPNFNSNSTPLIYSADPAFVLRPTYEDDDLATDVGGYQVTWGRWTSPSYSPVKVQTDLNDSSIFNTVTEPIVMTSVTATNIASLTGSGRFDTSGHFIGNSNAGTLHSVTGNFDIDLGSGQLWNGLLKVKMNASSSYNEWLSNSFTGTISDNGVLPQINISGRVKPWGSENSSSDPLFTGKLNGVLTGTGATGFVLGFDIRGATSQYITGITLLERTGGLPSFSSQDITALRTANRFGFLLVPNTPTIGSGSEQRVTLFGNVTQQTNAVDMIIDNDPSSLLTLDETPSRVARRNGSTIVQLTSDINVGGLGLNWGRWDASAQNKIKLETDYDDSDSFSLLENDAVFASFNPTSTISLTSLGSVKRTYLGSDSSIYTRVAPGNWLSNSYLPISEMRSIFDVDFETGDLTNGGLLICLGGAQCLADNQLAQGVTEKWKVSYTGRFVNGILTDVTLQNTDIADGTESVRRISGDLVGALVGEGSTSDQIANSFIGGLNLYETGTPAHFVSASYQIPSGSYLSASELLALGNGKYGIFATSGSTNMLRGGRAGRIENPTSVILADYNLLEIDGLSPAFNDYPPGRILTKGSATQSYINTNVGSLGSDLVTWGRWDATPTDAIRRKIRGSANSEIGQNAFWFIATPSVNENATGQYRYAKLLDYQIGTGSGTFDGKVNYFGFSMVMTTGAITNGHLSLEAGTSQATRKTWSVDFNGYPLTAKRDLVQFSITNGTIRDADKNLLSNVIVRGGMSGMFVKSGDAMVSAFALRNDNTAGPQEKVSGTMLVGQGVGWGAWNSPVGANWSAPTQAEVTDFFTRSSAVAPAANLTGEYNYRDTNDYLVKGSHGNVTSVDASLKVNLGTGVITNGALRVDVDAPSSTDDHIWRLNFAGNVIGGAVTLNNITNAQVEHLGTTTSTFTNANASLGGLFTGANAEEFLMGFDLLDQANNQHRVGGLVILDEKTPVVNTTQ